MSVRLDDPELCPRYTARVVKGVKIGPSPDWLRSALEKVGIRSISNVVDVTNYVMLEIGQPLHAFDYHLIARSDVRENARQAAALSDGDHKPTIVVRRAQAGEKFMTLDNQEHTLTGEMLLIADEQKASRWPASWAGRTRKSTTARWMCLIESAYFTPTNIRRTSKALGLRSDVELSLRTRRGHRHLRLGQPALRAIDPGNGRRPVG